MKSASVLSATLVSMTLLVATAAVARASDWPHDASTNLPVCAYSHDQNFLTIASDESGTSIIVWADLRNGTDYDIFAQSVDAYGTVLWSSGGESVFADADSVRALEVVSDGGGGVIVVWEDRRSGTGSDIHAGHIDAGGSAAWGVAVSAASNDQASPALVSDGFAGAILAWQDYRSATDYDIYARRVDSDGNLAWPDTLAVCRASGDQTQVVMAPDGKGGAILAWSDFRGSDYDIYAQRIDSGGHLLWDNTGVVICTALNDQTGPQIVSDGLGGAIIVWQDSRSGGSDIYAQRIGPSGNVLWAIDGATVCSSIMDETAVRLTTDGAGGAILAWEAGVAGEHDVFAQRIDVSGIIAWPSPSGMPVCVIGSDQHNLDVVSDRVGGAIITWEDGRTLSSSDIYAQHIDDAGLTSWTVNGVPISIVTEDQSHPRMASDGSNGAFIVWIDQRNGADFDVYAQRIERNGYLGYPSPDITAIIDYPQDQGGQVIVGWSASYLDAYPHNIILNYSLWRRYQGGGLASVLPGNPVGLTGSHSSVQSLVARAVAAGVNEALATSMAQLGWEFVTSSQAAYLDEYSYTLPTYADSSSTGVEYTGYMIVAEGIDFWTSWNSAPDSAYSVDNLFPDPPDSLTAFRDGNDVRLAWRPSGVNDEDVSYYSVYRCEASGFPADPAHFIASSADTFLLDTDVDAVKTYYYMVTAVDIHDNESEPSEEAAASSGTGGALGQPAPPSILTVLPNAPNPFRSVTTFEFGLSTGSDVLIEVYDVEGHLIASKQMRGLAPGWHTYVFNSQELTRGTLPSGVYFVKVESKDEVQIKRMVIVR